MTPARASKILVLLASAALLLCGNISEAVPITYSTSSILLDNLGQVDGTPPYDILSGAATTGSFNAPGTSTIVLNPLLFTAGYTGPSSAGTSPFSFLALVTIGSVTHSVPIFGTISIGNTTDTMSILSGGPTLFAGGGFNTVLTVLPVSISDGGAGTSGTLQATVVSTPEPGTLLLLGAGLAAGVLLRRRVTP